MSSTESMPQQSQEPSELLGGIKNALERGESMDKVSKSFLNAGYSQEEVQKAVNQAASFAETVQQNKNSEIAKNQPTAVAPPATHSDQKKENPNISSKPQTISKNTPDPEMPALPKPPSKSDTLKKPKKSKKVWIILAIVIALVILIGAGFVFLYWDQFFG